MTAMSHCPIAFAFALSLAALTPAFGADGWIADERTGCKIWARNVEPGDGVVWNGGCQNGLAEGRATYEFTFNGKANWKGEAEFRGGRRFGRGSAVNADGVRIEGQYRNGVLNGRVIEVAADGARYVGGYRDGERNGEGRYTYANGDRYDGEFRNGLPNGEGTFVGHNAVGGLSQWSGTWRDGCFRNGERVMAVLREPKDCGFD